MRRLVTIAVALVAVSLPAAASAQATRQTETYVRIKRVVDEVRIVDTHDHLWPFDRLPAAVETAHGRGVNLCGLWRNSYFTWYNPLAPWTDGQEFAPWWQRAQADFDNARASSFYR